MNNKPATDLSDFLRIPRRLLAASLLLATASMPLSVLAADTDGDSCDDLTDAYPNDYTRCAGATGILSTFNGDSASDYFGYSVSSAGDVNNDGVADVIIGSHYDDNTATDSGSARVISGANSSILYTFNGDGTSDYFGYSVSGAGDVNNDGYADLIVGAYLDDNTGVDSGSARVFSGANGSILYTFNGDSGGDYFGFSVSSAGDVNNDGYADVIVGAYYDDNTASNAGSARVFSGANGAILYTFNGDSASDYFGYSVSAAGDVNNDGYADVIVGAYYDDNSGTDSGSARVISGANGSTLYTFNGDSAGDYFGLSVSDAGDVNNDGYADVIVGAYRDDNTAADSGSARVFSGANGSILYTFNGDSTSDYFGYSVSGAGDVNNDGYADVVVGAYADDNAGTTAGSARVFNGVDGSILYTFNGDSASDYFGYSVSGAGDINNDGYADVIVGAYGDDNVGSSSGSARLFSGKAGLTDFDGDGNKDTTDTDDDNDGTPDINDLDPRNTSRTTDTDLDGVDALVDNCPVVANADQANTDGDLQGNACDTDDDNDSVADSADSFPQDASRSTGDTGILHTFNGDSASDNLGRSVSNAGDVNKDGYDDVIVGMPYDDNNARSNSGSARVFSGANGNVLYTFNGDSASDYFGYSVSGAGDVNKDGYDDVIVGAFADDNTGTESGSARVFSGANGAILYTFNGDSASDNFGYSVSSAGDVNQDGYADVIVGAYLDDNTASNAGSARVLSGANGAILYTFNGDSASDYFGYSVSGAGDVNNDGYSDLVVGAIYDDNNGRTDSGSARVLSGANGTTLYTFNGDSAGDYFGYSVSDAGDINNDGYADVVVGAYGDDNNGLSDSGSARVFSGANGAILYTFNGDSASDQFGYSVSGAGDVNNDDFADVIVGAYYDDNTATNAGSARVLSGANGSVLYVVNGDSTNDFFGLAVSGAGDVNGDGYADLLVGAYGDDNTATDSGSARLFSGRAATGDWDGDGTTDARDTNDDNDATVDVSDSTPMSDRIDSDMDGIGNTFDPDDDNDTVADASDNCLAVANADQLDTDGDAQGNACDTDDDADGVADATDAFPLDSTEAADWDADGTGNNADTDDDNDTVADGSDNCPLVANTDQANVDGDAQGTACDLDNDNDGVNDAQDNCPAVANPFQQDSDGDGAGNYCDATPFPESGSINGDFNPGVGANGTLWTLAEQADGKVVIGGEFSTYAGVSRNRIARLNTDGTLDIGFNPGTAVTGDYINMLVVQPDGRIVIVGLFTHYNGVARNNLARVNSDGSLDTGFMGASVNGPVYAVALQPDGKVLIGGDFTSVGGASYSRLARLNADGSVDTTFINPAIQPHWVATIAVQTDGKILAGGIFPGAGAASSSSIVRLNTDGSLDTGFAVGTGFDQALYQVIVQADGKILAGGGFSSYNGVTANRIARLNPDGSLDSTFNAGAGVSGMFVYTLAARDNKIVIGGGFSSYDGVTRNNVARLNSDGSIDSGFNQGEGANDMVYASAIRADGDLLVGGAFTAYNGIPRNRVALIVAYADSDGDGIDNGLDNDDDNDGTGDVTDNCHVIANADQANADGDIFGDACDENDDNDTLMDGDDNCLLVANPSQEDLDGDAVGDACDSDDDNDTVADNTDNCPLLANSGQANLDGDSLGDDCDDDQDGDTVANGADNCPVNANTTQTDTDGDGTGNVCDSSLYGDVDFDGVGDMDDNCPAVANADQTDVDSDSLGNACDADQGGVVAVMNPGQKIYASGGEVVVKVMPSDAGYTSELWLNEPAPARFIALNRDSGTIVNLGVYPAGQELVFKIYVRDTNRTFYTGPANRNGDNKLHAAANLPAIGPATVGFEDVWQGGDQDFNDNMFRFLGLTGFVDTDNDSIGDYYDLDDDGDGVDDVTDAFPLDATETVDTDNDGTGNNADTDDDGDTVADGDDLYPLDGAESADADGDGVGDNADTSDDGDSIDDAADNCLSLANDDQANNDGDANGDACDDDDDNDTVSDGSDNCPLNANPNQYDSDLDGLGNACDATAFPQAGSLDTGFNSGTGFNGTIWATEMQPDGKPVIGGEFTTFNGVSRSRIARLNSNGSLDTTFNPGTGLTGSYVNMMAIQADGKIVIGGLFTHYNGVARNNVARLLANGSLDTTFNPSGGVNGPVYAVAVQADGKVIIGGDFTVVGGLSYSKLARLNADGSVDSSFADPALGGAWVAALAVQADGKIIVGGYFTKADVTSAGIMRLLSDGSADTGFNAGAGVNDAVYSIAIQEDGKIVLGGGFTLLDGVTANRIARLNTDGSTDTAFAAAAGTAVGGVHVYSVALAKNKLIIGGSFSSYNSLPASNIARLNSDGSLDTDFQSGTGPNGTIYASRMQPNGDIIVGGDFTSYNGVVSNRVARLNGVIDSDNDGVIDAADIDDDNDSIEDEVDNCPSVSNTSQANMDRDIEGDACDIDDDNDGIDDAEDAFPLDLAETVDTDSDGTGNNADVDDDGDGVADSDETTLGTDPLDSDSDDDGLSDGDEITVYASNPRDTDSDSDGMPDGYEVSKGLDPADGNDDLLDGDGDGWTNKQEFDKGTDPASAASKPSAVQIPGGTGKFYVTNGSGALNELNKQTGGSTVIGAGAVGSDVEAMAMDQTGKLYALDETGSSVLGTVNTTTGVRTIIGTVYPTVTNGAEIAIDENNVLWWVNRTTTLYRINTATAAVTVVGTGSTVMNMIAAHQGVLYGVSSTGSLYSINKTNGVQTLVGATGVSCSAEDSLSSDGVDLWMLCESPAALYKLNKTTGQATWVTNTSLTWESLAIDIRSSTLDTDGDGMPDWWEILYGLNNNLASDSVSDLDGDGLINLQEYINQTMSTVADTDGDGWNDGREVNVERSNPQVADPVDTDSDGVLDASDRFPTNAAEWGDNDNDGTGDNADVDDDNDTVNDATDNCEFAANTDQLNTDGDTQGNACDTDDDNDTVLDTSDQLPLMPGVSVDADVDGFGDSWIVSCDVACQVASGTVLDNCPSIANADQLNTDGDSQGNACDTDDDNDGVVDASDRFPLDPSEWGDMDNDGVGNNTDADDDNDGLTDIAEIGLGTAANNPDTDADGLSDHAEVITHATNPLLADSDADGMPDGWEVTYSLNPLNGSDDLLDSDGDGWTNEQEYKFSANPGSAASKPDRVGNSKVGYYNVANSSQSTSGMSAMGSAIGLQGETITNLATHTLDGNIGILMAANGSGNSFPTAWTSQVSRVSSFVQNGGVLIFHDWNPGTVTATSIPGSGSIGFVYSGGSDLNLMSSDPLFINGPGGAVTNTSLDGGSSSNHGYVTSSTVPAGTLPLLSVGADTTKLVAYYYPYGAGYVVYAAMPLEHYLAGGPGSGMAVAAGMQSYTKNLLYLAANKLAGYPDADHDGMSDAFEDQYGLNKNSAADYMQDLDGDGLINLQESLYSTDPTVHDTDFDGASDYNEIMVERSNPLVYQLHDRDGDGAGDDFEVKYGFNPDSAADGALDADGDGLTNTAEFQAHTNPLAADTDGDTVQDGTDNCRLAANSNQLNTDGDAQGNVCDSDDDNDTVADTADAFPLNVAASIDADVDGIPSSWNAACNAACQAGSGLALDNCPANANANQLNTDGDSMGDVCDTDDDNDGVADGSDTFPLNPAESGDADTDGVGNNADSDDDNDTVADVSDNCAYFANADQADADGNGVGDVCDQKFSRLATGSYHTCAVTQAGAATCWGRNANYQLGDGTSTSRSTPVVVSGLTADVLAVTAGDTHSCALTVAGAVKCWGYNNYGQLGDGTTTTRTTPVQVSGLESGVKAIASGASFNCALKADGQVVCWGYNGHGQLGNGVVTTSYTPVSVSGLTGITDISAGWYHACALSAAGGMKCWGNNSNGELGDTTSVNRSTPVQVTGLTSGVSSISTGWYNSCAVTTAGALKCWGDGAYYQTGDGTTVDRYAPVQVTGLTSGLAGSDGGYQHACSLSNTGAVSCWGANGYGQVGDGSTTTRTAPVPVVGLSSGVVALAGGYYHSCALLATGAVKCWGYNYYGQLGNSYTANSATPVNVVYPQNQTITVTQPAPATAVYGSTFTVSATASSGLAVAITTAGGCSISGNTVTVNSAATACVVNYNQVGNASYLAAPQVSSTTTTSKGSQTITVTQPAPATIALGSSFTVSATASSGLGVAVVTSGACSNSGNVVTATALSTCSVHYTQPGNTNYNAATTIISTTSVSNPDLDADGVNNELDAFPNDPAEWADTDADGTGNNADADDDSDGLADAADNCPLITNVDQLDTDGNGRGDVCDPRHGQLAAGTSHSCAVTAAGGVRCWGHNGSGQLGDGTTTYRNVSVPVTGLGSGVVSVVAGDSHTCALMATGAVKCWGYNGQGAVGDGSTTTRLTPVTVSGLSSGVVDISAAYTSTCALLGTGEVRCWGSNNSGQLGDGTNTQRLVPVVVTGLSAVEQLGAGGYNHFCALAAGTVKCWGYNGSGQLGDGTQVSRSVPVSVVGLSGVESIAGGWYHNCAVTTAGAAMCWGGNSYGQLGDGTSSNRLTPTAVTGLASDVVSIEGAMQHTCAVTTGGAVKCWGGNGYGQLGDGSTTARLTPVQVTGLTSGQTAVVTGQYQSCALAEAGHVVCWGYNNAGQLGDNTNTNRSQPVPVYGWLAQSIVVSTPAPALAAPGTSFTVVVSTTSGLPVQLSVSGCSLSGSTVTMGTTDCTLTYSQVGNGVYLAAGTQSSLTRVDTDVDGYADSADAFPANAAEWLDTDSDGTGNNADTDDDNDGWLDAQDSEPLNPAVNNLIYPLNGTYKGSTIRDWQSVQ